MSVKLDQIVSGNLRGIQGVQGVQGVQGLTGALQSNYIFDGAASQWYTLQAADANREILAFSAVYGDEWGNSGITIPLDSEYNYPIGTIIKLSVLNTDIWVTNEGLDITYGNTTDYYQQIPIGSYNLIKTASNTWMIMTNVGTAGPTGSTGPTGPTGAQGVAGSQLIGFQILTTAAGSATYTPTAGTTKMMVVAIGGGGGSGRAVGSTLSNQVSGAGGSGSWCSKYITSVAASYSYSVGAGGTGDTGAGAGGGAGGATTITGTGLSLAAYGGSGGVSITTSDASTISVATSSSGGGTPTGGDLYMIGNPSTVGMSGLKTQLPTAVSSNGGHTPWGPGGKGATSDGNGTTPNGYGGGAGGAYASSSTARSGFPGAPGAILIWEYS